MGKSLINYNSQNSSQRTGKGMGKSIKAYLHDNNDSVAEKSK